VTISIEKLLTAKNYREERGEDHVGQTPRFSR
jgi:hypothetical protein